MPKIVQHVTFRSIFNWNNSIIVCEASKCMHNCCDWKNAFFAESLKMCAETVFKLTNGPVRYTVCYRFYELRSQYERTMVHNSQLCCCFKIHREFIVFFERHLNFNLFGCPDWHINTRFWVYNLITSHHRSAILLCCISLTVLKKLSMHFSLDF